jgi:hypothetical protein
VFEKVVNQAKVKGFVRRRDFEDVALLEADAGVKGARIFNISLAEVKSCVIERFGDAEPVKEAVIVS